MHAFFSGDDHTYSLLAGKILLGDFQFPYDKPYVQFAIQRYTVMFFLSTFYYIFGVNDLALGLLQMSVSIGIVYFVYSIVSSLFNKEVGLMSALLIALLPINIRMNSSLYPDPFATLFCLASLNYLILFFENKIRLKNLIFSGLFYCLAYFSTTGVLLFLPVLLLTFLFFSIKDRLFFSKKVIKNSLIFLIGFCIVFIPIKSIEYANTGYISSKAQSDISKRLDKNDTNILKQIIANQKKNLTRQDPLWNTFGIAKQYIHGATYYKNLAPYNIVILIIGLISFFSSFQESKKGKEFLIPYLYLLCATISLYFVYEFISGIFLRKLFRYYLNLHILIAMLGTIGIFYRIKIETVKTILLSTLSFLLIITILFYTKMSHYVIISTCASLFIFLLLNNFKKLTNVVFVPVLFLFYFHIGNNCYAKIRSGSQKFHVDFDSIEKNFPDQKIKKIYINSSIWLNVINYQVEYKYLDDLNNYWDHSLIPPPEISFIDNNNIDQLEPNALVIITDRYLRNGQVYGHLDYKVDKGQIQKIGLRKIGNSSTANYYITKERPLPKVKTKSLMQRMVKNKNILQAKKINLNLSKSDYRYLFIKLKAEDGHYAEVRIKYLEGKKNKKAMYRYLLKTNDYINIKTPLPKKKIRSITIIPTNMNLNFEITDFYIHHGKNK